MAKKKARKATVGRSGRRKMDMDKVRKKAEEIASRSQGEYHEIKQGWNYFFIMPPWSDELVSFKEVERHDMYVCAKKLRGSCILCNEYRKRLKRGDTEFTDKYRLKPTGFFNAVRKADIKKSDPDTIRVLRCSPTVFGEIIEFIGDEDVDISDPSAAYVVGIKRKGTGLQTRYKVKVSSEPLDISRYVTDKFLEGLFDLDTIRAALPASDKDLRKAIRSVADDGDADDGFDEDDLADDDTLAGDDDSDADDLADDDGDDIEDELFDDAEEDEVDPDEEDGEGFFGDEDEDEEEPEPPPRKSKKKVAKKARRRRD